MRYGSLGWIMMGAWVAAWPLAARADYLSDAHAAMKKGDLKAALIDLRNAVRADPQNAETHFWLGQISLELGDPVAAQREAEAARQRGFDPQKVVPLLAQSLLVQKKFDELLAGLKPLGQDPALDASILVSRGFAEIGLQRPADAQKSFAEAEQQVPNAVGPLLADARLSLSRGDLAGAQAKVDRAIQAQPKSVDALLMKATVLRLKNELPAAIAVLDGLIADQPSMVQARLDRTSLELASGKTDAAQADLDVVLKASPGNVQAIFLRAVIEAQGRNFAAADADLARIGDYLGRMPRAYYVLAMVKEQLGQMEQAEEAAQKFLGRSPNDLSAYKLLARLQFATHRPDAAIETLSKLAESGKGDAAAYDSLGRAYAATGRAAEAVQAFQKAETLAPNDIGVQARLASVQMGKGDVDAAIADLDHTLTLAPKLPAVSEALFLAALATGDTAKAGDALTRIRAAQGDTAVVANLEGLFKLAQIDFTGARAAFTDVVAKYPDFTPAQINLARVLAMTGDLPGAEKILSAILARQPASQPALSMLTTACFRSDRLAQAISLLEAAHRADPGQARVTVSLGDLYIRAKQPQKALDLAAADKAFGDKTSADKAGGEADGTAAASILGLRGAAYIALGQRKEARAAYADMLKQDPGSDMARRQLVGLLIEAGDYESARGVITASIAASPRTYQLYQEYVAIDLKSGGLDAALASADRLQAEDQDFAAIRSLKGDLYMVANRPADGVTAYAEAGKAAPSSQLTTRLADALRRAGRADDGSKLLADWLAQHPDDLVATEQAAEMNIAAGALDDAAKDLEHVLKTRPHNPVALNNLAWVYQQKGNAARAQALARQAYVLSPGAQTADTLGWILTTSGDAREGVPLLRQASNEATADPRISYHFGVALKDTGDRVGAKAQLESVTARTGEFKEKAEAQKVLDLLSKGS
jgi:putative PEP-CTERM system TPR-repeat lipoprotein